MPTRALCLVVLVGLGAAACSGTSERTPPADAVSLGSTTTTLAEDDPPIVIGGAPGADGHLPVRLNPMAWSQIETERVEEDPDDPFHEIRSAGHPDFHFEVELHDEAGPGWTGERGLFTTDCIKAGICVRLDPDGGAGPVNPITADPGGEIEIEQIEGGLVLRFRNLVFVRDPEVSYRIDEMFIDTT